MSKPRSLICYSGVNIRKRGTTAQQKHLSSEKSIGKFSKARNSQQKHLASEKVLVNFRKLEIQLEATAVVQAVWAIVMGQITSKCSSQKQRFRNETENLLNSASSHLGKPLHFHITPRLIGKQ